MNDDEERKLSVQNQELPLSLKSLRGEVERRLFSSVGSHFGTLLTFLTVLNFNCLFISNAFFLL